MQPSHILAPYDLPPLVLRRCLLSRDYFLYLQPRQYLVELLRGHLTERRPLQRDAVPGVVDPTLRGYRLLGRREQWSSSSSAPASGHASASQPSTILPTAITAANVLLSAWRAEARCVRVVDRYREHPTVVTTFSGGPTTRRRLDWCVQCSNRRERESQPRHGPVRGV